MFGIPEKLDLERINMEEYGQLILYKNKDGKKYRGKIISKHSLA